MERLYKRHLKDCPMKAKGIHYHLCDCPFWVDTVVNGKRERRSTGVADRATVEAMIVGLRNGTLPQNAAEVSTVGEAVARYIESGSVTWKPETIHNKRRNLADMSKIFPLPITMVSIRDVESCVKPTWAESTKWMKVSTFKTFFEWCKERGLIRTNPADPIKARKPLPGAVPLSRDEVDAVFRVIPEILTPTMAQRMTAACRLLLYTGLRCSDMVRFSIKSIADGYYTIRTSKTGAMIRLRVNPEAIEALRQCGGTVGLPTNKIRFYFWKISQKTGFQVCAKRWRITFACRLLEAGVELRTVSLLLGHSSVTTTERYYAPFVGSQQARLDAAIDLLGK